MHVQGVEELRAVGASDAGSDELVQVESGLLALQQQLERDGEVVVDLLEAARGEGDFVLDVVHRADGHELVERERDGVDKALDPRLLLLGLRPRRLSVENLDDDGGHPGQEPAEAARWRRGSAAILWTSGFGGAHIWSANTQSW